MAPPRMKPRASSPTTLSIAEPGIGVDQHVDGHAEAARVGEQRGDVAEHDPLMGEVDDGADVVLNKD
jgi:hypothetical protein